MDELLCGYSVTITWLAAGRPRDRQWAPGTLNKFTPSPKRPERLRGSPSLLFNGHLELFPCDKVSGE